jgi:DUF971 family protein
VDDPRYEPNIVAANAEVGLRITWSDGHVSHWDLPEVRRACPCAVCADTREKGRPVWPAPGSPASLDVTDADLVGAYGVTFHWNDGHQTGIFAWKLLRDWCDCDVCLEERREASQQGA